MLHFFLILLFIRPFISSPAFPYADSIYWLLLFLFLLCRIILKGLPLNESKAVKYPLVLFISALLVSTFFSDNKTAGLWLWLNGKPNHCLAGLKELQKYTAYLLIFLISASLTNKEKTKIIRTFILSGFIIGLLTIYQYFFGFQHLLDYAIRQGITNQFALDYIVRKRVFFPFVTPNALAGYLIMIIPLTLISRQTILLLIPLILGLFLTQSLGALLSLFLGTIIYFYLRGKFKKRRLFIILGLLALAGFIFITRMGTQKEHFQLSFSTAMRLSYWRETIQLIKSHPFIGAGPGNFDLADSRYAHNSYLQLWAETGILGIGAFIWLLFSIFRAVSKNTNYRGEKNTNICLYTASIIFLMHNFIDFTFFLPEIALIWWLISGLTISAVKPCLP